MRVTYSPRPAVRPVQLALCAAVFVVVCAGRGFFSERGEYAAAFSALGQTLFSDGADAAALTALFAADGAPVFSFDTVLPLESAVLTSAFGERTHPITGETALHSGVDLAAEEGAPIRAFAGGVVSAVGENESYGRYLLLTHADGVTSFYAHCSVVAVAQGQTVAMGETVAAVGQTGDATGPHLHFELRQDGVLLDPYDYVNFPQE